MSELQMSKCNIYSLANDLADETMKRRLHLKKEGIHEDRREYTKIGETTEIARKIIVSFYAFILPTYD